MEFRGWRRYGVYNFRIVRELGRNFFGSRFFLGPTEGRPGLLEKGLPRFKSGMSRDPQEKISTAGKLAKALHVVVLIICAYNMSKLTLTKTPKNK